MNIKECKLCPNVNYLNLNGFGSKDAKIVFISDAPSIMDFRTKQFYLNEKLVTTLLKSANIKIEDCYFTYLVKCCELNPNDKNETKPPKKKMITNCNQFLEEELNSLTQKKLIVLLGNLPLREFTGNTGITKCRGVLSYSEKYKCSLFPTLNYSILLHDINQRVLIENDFKKIYTIAYNDGKEIDKLPVKYIFIDTIEKFNTSMERLNSVDAFAFDIETTGFSPDDDALININFSWKSGTAIQIPILKQKSIPAEDDLSTMLNQVTDADNFWNEKDHKYIIHELKKMFLNNAKKIAHNAKFDVTFLKAKGYELNNLHFDTMIAHHLLDENAENMHGLKVLATIFTDMGDYESSRDEFFDQYPLVKDLYIYIPQEMMLGYGCADADCTFRLYEIFKPQIDKLGLDKLFYTILMPLTRTLGDAEYHGFLIDKIELEKNRIEMQAESDKILKEITDEVGLMNINSPKQLRELLYDKLKLPVMSKTDANNDSTDKKALKKLAKIHHIPKKILEYRSVSKLLNTFITGMTKKLDKNNIVHTHLNIIGTVTGRLSSNGPNLQQIPREDKRIKKMFIVPAGYKLLEADLAQAEFRVWGFYSQDPQMLSDIRNGFDVHKMVAAISLGAVIPKQVTLEEVQFIVKDITKDQRQNAKNTIFGVMYGRGARSVSEQLEIDEEEAKSIIHAFFSRYPQAKYWIDNVKETLPIKKQIKNMFGRIRRLPNINCMNQTNRSKTLRQCINSPIASAASDYNCYAANRIKEIFKASNLKSQLLVMVHDSQVYQIPDNEVDIVTPIIKAEMERLVCGMNVPMIAELKIGTRWSDLELLK